MTKSPRVLILDREPQPLLDRLNCDMPEIEAWACDSYAALPDMLEEIRPDVFYSITFAGRQGYPTDAVLGEHAPSWIAVGGSGVDHLGQWDPDKVTVTNSAGSAAAMMAEYVFGTLLHFTLDVRGMTRDQADRTWNSARSNIPLQGKTMLIVGLGQTGRAVAQRAKAFGMHVIGTRATPEPTENVDRVCSSADLTELWPEADFVVICVPLIPSTRGLVDARALAAMKPSAILVDVSRGGVVQSSAMINALRNGAIAGAALDVFETEPLPPDSPYWELENLIISPHSSSVFDDWAMQSFSLFLENLRNWQDGAPLFNIVDPTKGY